MWIDIVFTLVLAISFYRAYRKGLIKTVFAILAILIALFLTLKFSPAVIDLFEQSLKFGAAIAFILGTVITFLLAYYGMTMLGKLIERLIKTIRLNFLNKILGGIVGGFISIIILSFIMAFIDGFHLIPEIQKESSFCYKFMIQIPDIMRMNMERIQPYFEEFWNLARRAFTNE